MKQDIAIYVVDSFTDFAGKEHKLVACALSQSPINESHTLRLGWANKDNRLNSRDRLYYDIYRMVTVGIAICNPSDEFDLEVGKRIAYNKAANIEGLPRLYTTDKGVITQQLVDTFIQQQIQFVKENPASLIPGYKEAEADYKATQAAQQEISTLKGQDKEIFNLAVKGFDFKKYINLAKIYTSKIKKHD